MTRRHDSGRSTRPAAVVVTVLCLVLGALGPTACGAGDSAEGASAAGGADPDAVAVAADGGRLVYGVGFDVNTWSPFVERWLASGQVVAQAFYEPLATFDEEGEVVPYLAAAITPSDGYSTWTIELRPDIRFHDGTALDAEAVRRNLVTQGAGSGTNLSPINGVASVEVVDPLRVRVRTEHPWATFPVHLTGQLGNQAGYMASTRQIDAADPTALPVGTGPFVATSWDPGESMVGRRNDDYWRAGLPHLEEIEFRFIPDDADRLAELRSGALDAATFTDTPVLDEAGLLEAGDGSTLAPGSGDGLDLLVGADDPLQRFVVFNTAAAPTDDIEVRGALAAALDRDALTAEAGPGASRTDGPVASTSRWAIGGDPPPYDPGAAAATIAAYEAEHGPLRITLTAADDPSTLRRQQAVADAWTAVGVEVELEAVEQRLLPIRISQGETQATVFEKFSGVDPDSYVMFLLSTNVNPIGVPSLNLPHLADPAIDEAVMAGRATEEADARRAAYTDVQRRLEEEVPFVWLSEMAPRVIASDRVRGLAEATSPDGARLMPMISGRHGFGQVWLAPLG